MTAAMMTTIAERPSATLTHVCKANVNSQTVNLSTIACRVDGHDLNHKHVIRLIHCSAFQHAQTHAGCAKGRSHTKNANNNMVLTAKDLVHTNTTTTTLHGCVLIAAETNPTHLNMQLEHNMA